MARVQGYRQEYGKQTMGSTLTLTLACTMFWLAGPEAPVPGQPAPETPPVREPVEKGTSEAEKIARLSRMIEGDEKHLAELKKRLEDPESEYRKAEKAFAELDNQKKELEQLIQKLRDQGEARAVAEKQEELQKLHKPWQAARERFDLAIQERKTFQESIVNLEKKIRQDRQALEKLTTPATVPAPVQTTAPQLPSPGGGTKAAASSPVSPGAGAPAVLPSAIPVVKPLEQGTSPASPAPSAPPKEKEGPKEEKAWPASKELVQAQVEARVKEETARKAQARAQTLTARIDALRESIHLEEKLLATARKKSDQADADKTALEEELKKKVAGNAPDSELQDLWMKIDRARQRIQAARDEARASADRLHELSSDLNAMQAEHITALREAEEKGKEADAARHKVAQLQHPFHPANIMRWCSSHGPPMVLIIVAMLLLRWLAKVSSNRVVKLLARGGPTRRVSAQDRENRAQTLAGVFLNTASLFILAGGVIMLLDEAGVSIGPLMGGAAVIGLAVAFGAQNLIRDYFSGFMVLVEDQYGVNDVVRINDLCGLVEHISLRMTVIRDIQGVVHFVPHGVISTVSNLTHGWSRALFDIGVAYKEDVDRVMGVITDLGQELRHDPRFQALILGDLEMLGVDAFSDSAVMIRFHLKTIPLQQWAVKREMLRRIKKKFDELGIEIPFPHRTVYHRSDDPLVVAYHSEEARRAA